MLQFKRVEDEKEQRLQLRVLGLVLIAVALFGYLVLGGSIMPIVLAIFAAIALGAACVFRSATEDVYLAFALVSFLIGRMISVGIVAFVYVVGIAGIGAVLRLAGMDRMGRNFARCRSDTTMFVNSPKTDAESFERQS